MIEIFDRFDQPLLILGAPGSGKTTLLLELADELLDRAAGSTAPIPVVFNLSSWRGPDKHGSRTQLATLIDDWMIAELVTRYGIPQAAATRLVRVSEIVVLLDGLDEVAGESRAACVRAINAYRSRFGLTRVVVCCRDEDYTALDDTIDAAVTVGVEPLSRSQVERFLDLAGEPLAAVRAALAEDAELWTLLESPLMLSVIALAHAGTPVDAAQRGDSVEQRRDRLFVTYVRAMLARRPDARFAAARMVRQLTFIAAFLEDCDRVLFHWEQVSDVYAKMYVELRPTLLELLWYVVPVAVGVLVGTLLSTGLGVVAGIITLFGCSGAGITGHEVSRSRVGPFGVSSEIDWDGRSGRDAPWLNRILGNAIHIEPPSFFVVTGGLLVILLVAGLVLDRDLHVIGLVAAVIYGAIIAGCIIFVVPLTPGPLTRRGRRELPGPWMRAVLRGGLVDTVRVVVLVPVIPVLLVGVFSSWDVALRFGAATAATSAVVCLVCRGGRAAVEQVEVRHALHREDLLALPSQPLLGHAVECLLMRKVGDDYMFVHRSLQECLARRSPHHRQTDAVVDPILP